MPRGRRPSSPHQKALYALGVAFAAYGAAVLPPEGNGFIAVFVGAIALGIRRPDIRDCFEERSEDVIELVKLGVFVVFGALLTFDCLFADGWAAVAHRRLHPAGGAPGGDLRRPGRQRAGGHRLQGLHGLVRAEGGGHHDLRPARAHSDAPNAERVAAIAALAVFVSIIAHGLTDHPGAEWMARHAERRPEAAAVG